MYVATQGSQRWAKQFTGTPSPSRKKRTFRPFDATASFTLATSSSTSDSQELKLGLDASQRSGADLKHKAT